ncbi:VanW family protein [Gaiella sp.]|uniref:VanW family protein n=1 Tax=Gaiella sp. TaxID=2663207 RepID=UPI0032636130
MPDIFVSSARRPHRRRRRSVVVIVALGAIAAVLAAGAGAIALRESGTIAARTTIGGVSVGGMSREEAAAAIIPAGRRTIARSIRLIGPRGETSVTGAELGARPRLGAALDEAVAPGARTRLLRRLGFGDERTILLTYRLGPVRAAELANRLDDLFGEEPKHADLEVSPDGGSVTVTTPAPGTVVDRAALRRGLASLPAELGIPLVTRAPSVGVAEAEGARARVARLLDGPREVRFRDATAVLPVAALAGLVTTKPAGGRLLVELDPEPLRQALLPRLGRFERPAVDARFVTNGAKVRLIPASPGKALDADRIGASLVGNVAARAHRARFTVSEPEFTTEAAEKLRITELVSEFTTYYTCCAPRVTNIKRAAELLDGTIILPGKEFSLNGALGKRTENKGFVSAPQIFNGRFEDAVGGGISQVATTLFNAAFFSGIKLVEHRAHQFYISRYPMGREATVSWGGPELIFKNDWPAAILMTFEATDSGITVRFFSTKLGRRVTTTTGKPYLPTTPETVTVTNPALPEGKREVVQEAGDGGFTIDFTRKVFRDGKLIRNELYRQKYDAENEIVEVGPR